MKDGTAVELKIHKNNDDKHFLSQEKTYGQCTVACEDKGS